MILPDNHMREALLTSDASLTAWISTRNRCRIFQVSENAILNSEVSFLINE